MMNAALKTTEYEVFAEPEYGSAEALAAARRTMVVQAESPGAAALVGLRALTGSNARTVPSRSQLYRTDPDTASRFLSRPNKEGDRFSIRVDLSAAEKQRKADAEAAKKAAIEAEEAALAPERAAFEAARAECPGLRVSVSARSVDVTYEVRWGNDYARTEVEKKRGWYSAPDGTPWEDPATIRTGNGTLENPATDLPVLLRGLRFAGAVAALLDAEFPKGSAAWVLAEDPTRAQNLRAHADWFRRIREVLDGTP